jgi:phosphoribosylformimino-5-aminoimidazole carboxamide ribotide isomerase
MQILPVLDLMNGLTVRGVAGRRDEYRPRVSPFADSAEPLAIARGLRAHFGFTEFYLADLDAIQDARPNREVYEALTRDGFALWIDAGLRRADDPVLDTLQDIGASVVAGLESIEGPAELQRILQRVGIERAVFSLDLKVGRALGRVEAWPAAEPWPIARHAIEALGVRRLIVLDLAQVGLGGGTGTEELCVQLKQAYPTIQLTAGGGVRGIEDVRRLAALGVDRALVASALHDGRITPENLRKFDAACRSLVG